MRIQKAMGNRRNKKFPVMYGVNSAQFVLVRIFRMWVLLFLILPLAYSQETETRQDDALDAQDYYAQGKELFEKGDLEGANRALKKAEALLKGTSYDYPEIDEFKPLDNDKADKQNTEESPGAQKEKSKNDSNKKKNDIYSLAEEAYSQGKFNEALSLYEKVEGKSLRNHNLHYNLGVLYTVLNDYNKAAQHFKKAISLNRRDEEAYYNLGVLYENYLNDKKQAVYYYRKYMGFLPKGREEKEIESWIGYIDTFEP
ncbi:MAG: tetratricopeptide repeat protein [Candidatus Omnitrophota bacterium]